MKRRAPADQAWIRLTRRAAAEAPEPPGLPPGFAARVVAAWKASPGEATLAALEGLTWRGLAVALVIFCGCAALGYDSLVNAVRGEAARAGVVLSEYLGL